MFMRAVRPLYLVTTRSEPEFWGTGVLLQFGDARFVATAAHVVHRPSDGEIPHGVKTGVIMTFGSESHVELNGRVHRTLPPEGRSYEEDKADVALIELSLAEVAQIDDSLFLESSNIDVRDHLAPRRGYFLLGFPHNWQKRDLPAASFKVRPFPFIGREVDADVYDELGYPRIRNLAVKFDRKRIRTGSKVVTAPDPGGTSGGGWWRIDNRFGPLGDACSPKLVALMSKHYPRGEKVLLAVRISVVIQLLATSRPDLRKFLPDVSWLPPLERWDTFPGAFVE